MEAERRPIEVYCPICGFHEAVNCEDERLAGLSRDAKIERIRELQESDHPFFTCDGCGDPTGSARVLEIR